MSERITCRCGASWTGASRAHCSGCHETFNSVRWFDKHRKGGSCRRPKDLGLVWDGSVWKDSETGFDGSVFYGAGTREAKR